MPSPVRTPARWCVAFALTLAPTASAEIFAPRSLELRDGPSGDLAGDAGLDDRLGRAVAVGDFDGDGFDDIAAGDLENGGGGFAGAVHVIHGGAGGLSTVDDQLWTDFDPETLFSDVEGNDRFGAALAAGDFDGDGFDDLAIGVPGETVGANFLQGFVLVLYGGVDGLDLFSTPAPRRLQLGAGGIGGVPSAGDNCGYALTAGDFSGDGFDDVAVGIPGMNVGPAVAGGVLVVYGSAAGLQTSNELILSQDFSTMPEVAEPNDAFGTAVAAADFDADGNDDLAIGVPGEATNSTPCVAAASGAVQILYGTLGAGLTLLDNQLWNEANVDTGGDCSAGDGWGTTLAAGDLTADGAADLVVGAPKEDLPGVVDAGAITLLLGSVDTGIFTGASTLYDESDFPAAANPQIGDNFGAALAIGDFREDPIPERLDLAIGTPFDHVWNGFESVQTGSVLLTEGGLLQPMTARLWAPGLDGTAGSFVGSREFGGALAAGDFDGDGHGDLVVGISGSDLDEDDAGALHVAFGSLFADGFEAGDSSLWSSVEP